MWFHLSERSPSDERIDVVSVQELFPVLDDVVVILIVEAVVVQLPLLLAMMIRLLHLAKRHVAKEISPRNVIVVKHYYPMSTCLLEYHQIIKFDGTRDQQQQYGFFLF